MDISVSPVHAGIGDNGAMPMTPTTKAQLQIHFCVLLWGFTAILGKMITLPALPLDLRDFQLQQEKRLLQRSLQQAKYHQKQAAELLGLTYHQLRALLKKHQL